DQRPAGEPAAGGGVGAPVVAAADEAGVDLLELIGHARPLKSRPQRVGACAQALAELGLAQEALELGGQGLRVTGLEYESAASFREQLLVSRQARGYQD